MPWHWQTVFRFHRHQRGNKHLALIKLPIFPLADCSLPGLRHIFCSSCSFPTHTLLPHRASTTLCMAGQQTDSAENLPGSKIQFPNVIYHKVAWTAVQAQRETKNSERVRICSPGYGLIKLESLSPGPCSKQPNTAPVQGTASISICESEMVLVTNLPCLQNASPKDVHVAEVRWSSQLFLSLNSCSFTMWFVWSYLFLNFILLDFFNWKKPMQLPLKEQKCHNLYHGVRHSCCAHLSPHSKYSKTAQSSKQNTNSHLHVSPQLVASLVRSLWPGPCNYTWGL